MIQLLLGQQPAQIFVFDDLLAVADNAAHPDKGASPNSRIL
ncbi:MAG: hypothetical protein AB1545_15750 [Thermodesulfobacteriota bacterium]